MSADQEKYEFIIVQKVSLSREVAQLIEAMQHKLLHLSSSAKKPKMDTHVTVMPPFCATKEMISGLAAGLKVAQDLYDYEEREHGRGVIRYGKVTEFKFFRNPNNDVLFLSVDLDHNNKRLLEIYRKHLLGFVDFKYPPLTENKEFTPHITIMEGETLCNDMKTELFLSGFRLDQFNGSRSRALKFFPLDPKILMKLTDGSATRWEEVYPTKFKE